MTTNTTQFLKIDLNKHKIACYGEWVLANIPQIKTQIDKIHWPKGGEITVDGKEIKSLDSACAWLLLTWLPKKIGKNVSIRLENFSEQHQKLISLVEKKKASLKEVPKRKEMSVVARVGEQSIIYYREFRDYLAFVGELFIIGLRNILRPSHWRWNEIISIVDRTGLQALPIIALLSFMIGIVLAYQLGVQLRDYGANVFIVDLLGISILREFGPMLTAIMVAGRTGSSFTAQLGIMKINQEIDALNTMGVTPAELLLIPRVFGLFIALPLLTMWADIFGVIGGVIMSNSMLGIGWQDFFERFQHQVPLKSLIIGLGKAPVFALIIASIGCFEGMQVRGSADSVGKLTTRSVVWAIFFIIVTDAAFSVILSRLKL